MVVDLVSHFRPLQSEGVLLPLEKETNVSLSYDEGGGGCGDLIR